MLLMFVELYDEAINHGNISLLNLYDREREIGNDDAQTSPL
jgi:hypothetical protein